MNVFILATCRKPDLWPATALVFDTIRTGFPTARIVVTDNHTRPDEHHKLAGLCAGVGAILEKPMNPTVHHAWIENLFLTEVEPFFICDTDVIFWKNFEGWTFDKPLAGVLMPRFYESFTKTITRSRLHTCLQYFDPVPLRSMWNNFIEGLPKEPFNPKIANPIYPVLFPCAGAPYYDDTTGVLFQAVGGQAFTDEQMDCFDHIQCGTYVDYVSPVYLKDGFNLAEMHQAIFKNPGLAKGWWRSQMKFLRKADASFQDDPNKDSYQKIHGWMDYEEIYDRAVQAAPSNGIFVEVGSWLGRSACYMAQKIRESGKDLELFCVDNWYPPPSDVLSQFVDGSILAEFHRNTRPYRDIIFPITGDSSQSARHFANGSVDFVWLDAGHEYESVKSDLLSWLPKVKSGGVIAGHDYGGIFPGVEKAVKELIPNFRVEGNSWIRE